MSGHVHHRWLEVQSRCVLRREAMLQAAIEAIRENRTMWIVGPGPEQVQTAERFLREQVFATLEWPQRCHRVATTRRDCRP